MLNAITDSFDLAVVLNATPADAAETPRDWIAGTLYPLDAHATTDDLAILADSTAAVRPSPAGEFCAAGDHRTCIEAMRAHWCPADQRGTADRAVVVYRDGAEFHAAHPDLAAYPASRHRAAVDRVTERIDYPKRNPLE